MRPNFPTACESVVMVAVYVLPWHVSSNLLASVSRVPPGCISSCSEPSLMNASWSSRRIAPILCAPSARSTVLYLSPIGPVKRRAARNSSGEIAPSLTLRSSPLTRLLRSSHLALSRDSALRGTPAPSGGRPVLGSIHTCRCGSCGHGR